MAQALRLLVPLSCGGVRERAGERVREGVPVTLRERERVPLPVTLRVWVTMAVLEAVLPVEAEAVRVMEGVTLGEALRLAEALPLPLVQCVA